MDVKIGVIERTGAGDSYCYRPRRLTYRSAEQRSPYGFQPPQIGSRAAPRRGEESGGAARDQRGAADPFSSNSQLAKIQALRSTRLVAIAPVAVPAHCM